VKRESLLISDLQGALAVGCGDFHTVIASIFFFFCRQLKYSKCVL
jgi:hypothetical protein